MKKSYAKIIRLIVTAAIIAAVYLYFQVPGKSIKGVSDISEENTVVISKGIREREEEGYTEYLLNKKQTAMLKDLIEKSHFTRVMDTVVYFSGKSLYDIFVKDSGGDVLLYIFSVGGKYITVSGQFNGKHLKIKNPDWDDSIEKILNSPDN